MSTHAEQQRQAEQKDLDLVRDAAERGVSQAQLLFGQMLLDGKLIERNLPLALHWFERAAKGGEVMAINMVGRCLDQGWGVARSAVLAEQWFRKAAERGLDWGMYNLATLLALGEGGVPLDRGEALMWLRHASDRNHAKSLNLLGGFYEDGWEVAADRDMARELYRRSADVGDFRGHFNHGRLLAEDGDEAGALASFHRVPQTATAAFITKMHVYLKGSPSAGLREFAATLGGSQSATMSRQS